MAETWGDRSTVERAILRVVQSMAQWQLLRSGEEKGSLTGPIHRISISGDLGLLLLHATLLSSGKSMRTSNLVDHPALFPFSVRLTAGELMGNPIFRVQRQGDQMDIVDLVSIAKPNCNALQPESHSGRNSRRFLV